MKVIQFFLKDGSRVGSRVIALVDCYAFAVQVVAKHKRIPTTDWEARPTVVANGNRYVYCF